MALIDMDRDQFPESFPLNLIDILHQHNWRLSIPDDSSDEHDPYQHAIRGKCMFDGHPLGEDTIAMVTQDGVIGLWCSGQCCMNMHAVTFMQEVTTMIVENR